MKLREECCYAIAFDQFFFIFLLFGILLIDCAGRRSAILETPRPAAPGVNASALRAEADKLWKKRDNPPNARQALETYKRAYVADPSNVELGTRLARAYYFVAHYVETNPQVRDTLFQRGAETGERTLALNLKFRTTYQKKKDEARALATLDKSWINAIYWTGTNLDHWMSLKSTWVRLGNKKQVEAYLTRVRELDPNFFYGAAQRFFGALPTRVPFGDLDGSKREFEKALAMAPNFFGNHRTYAEYYAVKRKDRELFKKLLETVINGNPNALPDMAPENKFEQEMAKRMLERIDEYFGKNDKK